MGVDYLQPDPAKITFKNGEMVQKLKISMPYTSVKEEELEEVSAEEPKKADIIDTNNEDKTAGNKVNESKEEEEI